MKSLVLSFFVALIFVSLPRPLLAGDSGHGGEVVLCDGQSPQMYDVYEALVLRKLSLNLGPQNISYEDKIRMALERIKPLDIERPRRYAEWAGSFVSEAKFGDFDLEPLEDSKHIAVPRGCKIRQLVDQREPRFPGDKRYFVDQGLWARLDNDQKAVALLHELIYREAIQNQQTDSVGTRYFNSIIFSDKISSFTPLDYIKVSQESGLRYRCVVVNGVYYSQFSGDAPLNDPSQKPWVGYSWMVNQLFGREGFPNLPQQQDYRIGDQVFQAEMYGDTTNPLSFYVNGVLAEAIPNIAATPRWRVGQAYYNLKATSVVIFYDNGAVRALVTKDKVQVLADGKSLTLAAGFMIGFYRDGKLAFGTEVREQQWFDWRAWKTYRSNYDVSYQFDEQGHIVWHSAIHDHG